ncbi:MAG: S41 family peptidase [Flavobacteriales bacterium]|nr:S41 family peptidase [Flavobacteriales bacterium]
MKKTLKKVGIGFLTFSMIAAASYKGDFFEVSKNLEIYSDIYKTLNVYYVDDTQPGKLMKTGIDAMLKSLDPYTKYYPESKIEDYRFTTTGQYGGIGALIREIDGSVYISEPYEDSPAKKAGLVAGDRIISIDGTDIADKNQDEVSKFLKGQAGTELEVVVERNSSEKIEVNIKREEIKIPDVPFSGMVDEKTGYLKLSSFTQTASSEVKKAYRSLEKEGMEQLIFDLRGNGGGLLREAVNIVNFFVPKGTDIVSTKGKLEEWEKTHKGLNEPLSNDIPVVVLVDAGSASASEIVSGTLQDLDRAVVVGMNSFGKGLVQQTKDIPYGTKLKLTVAKYYTPSGRCIQKLDYFNKEDGEVSEVPDSLVAVYKTKNGRDVYDGRGIYPDVKVELDEYGKILEALYDNHVIFKYANEFQTKNPEIAPASEFALSDEQYDEFVAFARLFDLHYTTASEENLKDLMKVAKKEKYFEDLETELLAIEKKLDINQKDDIYIFKDMIKRLLENEIVSRYYYQSGRAEHSLDGDPFMVKALEILNGGEINSILSGKK